MKKSISVILVAALMLFAFTACEQQMPTYKTPVGMTLEASKTEYLENEAFDPSTLSAVVTFSDNSTTTLTGSEISYTFENVNGSSNQTLVQASYGIGTNAVEASTLITEYNIETVDLGNLPETVSLNADKKAVADVSGVTVTVTYDNGQKERVLTSADYKLAIQTNSAVSGEEVTFTSDHVSYKIFGMKPASATVTFEGESNWEVAIAEVAPEDPAVLTDVVMGYYEKEAVTGEKDKYTYTPLEDDEIPQWIGDDVTGKFFVLAEYSDGTIVELSEGNPGTADSYTVISGEIPAAPSAGKGGLPGEEDAVTFRIICNADPSLNIQDFVFVGEDYIKSVAFKKSSTIPANIYTDMTVETSWISATATWASGERDESFGEFYLLTDELPSVKTTNHPIWVYWVDKDGEMQWDDSVKVGVEVRP